MPQRKIQKQALSSIKIVELDEDTCIIAFTECNEDENIFTVIFPMKISTQEKAQNEISYYLEDWKPLSKNPVFDIELHTILVRYDPIDKMLNAYLEKIEKIYNEKIDVIENNEKSLKVPHMDDVLSKSDHITDSRGFVESGLMTPSKEELERVVYFLRSRGYNVTSEHDDLHEQEERSILNQIFEDETLDNSEMDGDNEREPRRKSNWRWDNPREGGNSA